MSQRVLALLMSIPLLASSAAGVALHVCQSMGGVAVGDCECEGKPEQEGHDHHQGLTNRVASDQLKAQPCCTVELTDPARLLATKEAPSVRIDDAAIAFVGVGGAVPLPGRLAGQLSTLRVRAPPDVHGPPIFVRNRSFLN